ncbi:helix-turn-helix domain-containing protein [Bradyrhizobium sp. SSUT112]|uniref:helix-turn-helix domain-containing protein n=1 Tax=Bradyrhizobium sp. SSUT112 TaxID=3040604 RepID=UPI002448E686|nr:helix-turn-helix domain-containing protein [Bradyrhizobium sp. SSUT112]MDH2355183.1 helix-turn-helix domain-containing protein [Bradyrhizobium sp. SSUT112]
MADVPVCKTEPGSVIGVSVVESVDAADHAGRFHGWDLRIDQVSSGRFAGRLVMIRLGSLEIIRETISQALIKQGSAWPDSLVFSLPLAASNEAHFNGRPFAFPNVLLSDGADLPPLLTPTQLDVVSIAIARNRLTSLLETLGERRAADLVAGHRQQNHCFTGSPGALSTLQHGFREICDQGNRLQSAIGFARARASLEDAVVDALADILSENAWRDVNGVTAQKRIVDRIKECVFAHADDPPSIAELCRHVGVSRRTLQGCFRDALGLTPLQYLRMLRLNAVRRELRALAAARQPVSIGDVAARWGFWHWSRFTENYRQLFGELPSHTVRRVLSASV